ncbi:MAG: phosphonate C-P lyase system protein PhnH [Deltaproteobacteria bacterium]|jgi:alpha-D-ribose 1-methylphosphonate 5-triphosphate synthase subunit PhnH|nr:phosphonate C-P lyase system protein PhnH [Deltaproteobacteria bacterium]
MNALPMLPGFADPVDDAQAIFRAVLSAFSRPGLPVSLSVLPPPFPLGGFSRGMLALALALCDKDTPLWLDDAADTPTVRRHLRFHCAVPFAAHPAAASFAFVSRPEHMPRLQDFYAGQAEYPDRSATLVISAELSALRAPTLEFTGPGVKGNERGRWQRVRIFGLPAQFWKDWEANHAAYPLGVDVLFVDAGSCDNAPVRVLGLPRAIRVRSALNGPADAVPPEEAAACM